MQHRNHFSKPATAEPEKQSSRGLDSMRQIAVIVAQTAEILKAELSPAEAAFWSELLNPYPVERIKAAFSKHIRTETFFPKPAQIFALLDGDQKSEALAAWDAAVDFVSKWVQSDPYGNYRIEQGCRRTPPPQLAQRILDTVRLAGGWRAIRCMTDDAPFVKKAFVEAYESWTAIREVPPDRLLVEIAQKALPAKPAPRPTGQPVGVASTPTRAVKRIPEPLTAAQLQDRRALLKQQIQRVNSPIGTE